MLLTDRISLYEILAFMLCKFKVASKKTYATMVVDLCDGRTHSCTLYFDS